MDNPFGSAIEHITCECGAKLVNEEELKDHLISFHPGEHEVKIRVQKLLPDLEVIEHSNVTDLPAVKNEPIANKQDDLLTKVDAQISPNCCRCKSVGHKPCLETSDTSDTRPVINQSPQPLLNNHHETKKPVTQTPSPHNDITPKCNTKENITEIESTDVKDRYYVQKPSEIIILPKNNLRNMRSNSHNGPVKSVYVINGKTKDLINKSESSKNNKKCEKSTQTGELIRIISDSKIIIPPRVTKHDAQNITKSDIDSQESQNITEIDVKEDNNEATKPKQSNGITKNKKSEKKQGKNKCIEEMAYEYESPEVTYSDRKGTVVATRGTNTLMVDVNERFFLCDVCNKTWRTEYELHKHQSRRHKIKYTCPKYKFKCHLCGKGFQRMKSVSMHLSKTHSVRKNKKQKEYVCEECGKKFVCISLLRIHERCHTGERPWLCHYCPKAFATKGFLKVHTRTHTGDRPFPCSQCDKRFGERSALFRHQRVHTGEKPYSCPECGSFSLKPNYILLSSVKVHTGEKPYSCPECASFSLKPNYILLSSVKVHTGEKPYSCPECASFSLKPNYILLSSVKVHTGEKPYSCPECGKSFSQSNSMKLHVMTVHLGQPTPYKSRKRKAKDNEVLEPEGEGASDLSMPVIEPWPPVVCAIMPIIHDTTVLLPR